jgi:hypothetical protein
MPDRGVNDPYEGCNGCILDDLGKALDAPKYHAGMDLTLVVGGIGLTATGTPAVLAVGDDAAAAWNVLPEETRTEAIKAIINVIVKLSGESTGGQAGKVEMPKFGPGESAPISVPYTPTQPPLPPNVVLPAGG